MAVKREIATEHFREQARPPYSIGGPVDSLEGSSFRPWDWLILVALLGLYFLMRWPFRELPLIRDEGEYAHLGQVIASGGTPYVDAYNQKPPLVFLWTAGVQALFGSGLAPFRIATNVYGTATLAVWIVFARRHFGTVATLGCGLAYCLLANQVENMLHQASTEFFLLPWFALAILLWFGPRARRAWPGALWTGLCVGLAMQTKQTGIWLMFFLVTERIWHWIRVERPRSIPFGPAAGDIVFCGLGALAVQVAVMVSFFAIGAWGSYWECVWVNNYEYLQGRHARYPFLLWLEFLRNKIFKGEEPLWLFAVAGLVALEITRQPRRVHGMWLLLASTLLMGYMARQHYVHYFLPTILPTSLGCGVACGWLVNQVVSRQRRVVFRLACLALVVVPFVMPVREQKIWLFQSTEAVCGGIQISPFVEAKMMALLLAERTEPGEPVFIIGSEPEIYFYANRPNATRLVIMYPMTGPYSYAKPLLDEFVDSLRKTAPRYVVLVNRFDSLTEFPRMTNDFLIRVTDELSKNYVPELMIGGNPPVLMYSGDFSSAPFTLLRRKDIPAP